MAERRRPTSALLHERDRLRDAVFTACREGHIKDLKKLKPQLEVATKAYEQRLLEDEQLRIEKEKKKRDKKK